VSQPATVQTERRHDPRVPAAFAVWLRPADSERRTSSWMLDIAAGGAAMLTPTDTTPPVGQRLEFTEMQTHDRMVREGMPPLPRFGRVLRHDESIGLTRRIAVKFESDTPDNLRTTESKLRRASAPRSKSVPVAPPMPEVPGLKAVKTQPA